MIKEKVLNNYHTANTNSNFFKGKLIPYTASNVFYDSLKIKIVQPKLELPKSSSTLKLQKLNERIQRIDPKKTGPIITKKIIKVAEPDTSALILFDEDTIAYVKNSGKQTDFQAQNFFYNIPDYKPFHKLVDTTVIKKDSIKIVEVKKAKSKEEVLHVKTPVFRDSNNNYREHFSASWIPGFLIILFLLIAWIRVFYNKVLKLTMRGSFNVLISGRLFREKNIFTFWGNSFLNILYFLTGGFFLYLLFIYSGYRINSINDITISLLIMSGLLIIYTGKTFFVRLLGIIFKENEGAAKYLHNVFLYNKTLGIVLIPFVVVIPYVPEPGTKILLVTGVAAIFFFYFLRLLRGLRIGFRLNISIFYLILYLCTLEFFPVLILYKLFISYTR